MESSYKTIILQTDASKTSQAAEQSALNLAKQFGARVIIVDTVRPPSIASQWFTSNSEDVFEMVVNDKTERLEKIAEKYRADGVTAEVKILFGKSSEEVARAVVTEDADLVVRYMKGAASRHPGRFGNTARNLMRICPCPVLVVGDEPISQPRVLACVNAEHDSNENESILEEAEKMAGESNKLRALYCWKFYGSEMLKNYMDDKMFQQSVQEAEHVYRGLYENFLEKYELGSFDQGVHMENGEPVEVIPQFCRDQSVDVVVMSSASQNHPIRRLLGSTIESVLDELPCALLVVKPLGFKSPIKPAKSSVKVKTG